MNRSCLLILLWATAFQPEAVFSEPPPGYLLTWFDEFDGTCLNTAEWNFRTDSKHWSTQLPANVTVGNGWLHLCLKKQSVGGKEYTGAGVISRRTFKYGYYESRFRVPAGAGWHSSFWLMRDNGSGGTRPALANQEIDICEQDSVHPDRYAVNLHDWSGEHLTFGHLVVETGNLAEEFHVWGCEFTPERIRYFLDGKLVQELDARVLKHGEHNIWLTSIASFLGGTEAIDEDALPQEAVFDYVRYYAPQPKDWRNPGTLPPQGNRP